MTDISNERFCVYQFFQDGTYEKVRDHVTMVEATKAVEHYCTCVAARMGIIVRVIVTDANDFTCFEWKRELGVTFPPPEPK